MVYSPEFFRQFPIFSDLTSNELAGVAEISNQRSFPKGTNIFIEGEERKAVYFILSGLVRYTKSVKKGKNKLFPSCIQMKCFHMLAFLMKHQILQQQ